MAKFTREEIDLCTRGQWIKSFGGLKEQRPLNLYEVQAFIKIALDNLNQFEANQSALNEARELYAKRD